MLWETDFEYRRDQHAFMLQCDVQVGQVIVRYGYTNDENNSKFHRELLKLANRAHCMIFISGYANDLYEQLLTKKRGWSRKTIKTSTRDSSGKIHKRTEVVWMNKHFQNAQKENKIAINLNKTELKQKKLNPIRTKVIHKTRRHQHGNAAGTNLASSGREVKKYR